MLNALSNMPLEIWIMSGCMVTACLGWSYEYYKGKKVERKARRAYKAGYERGVKETMVEYEFKEEMKKWTA